MNLENAIAALEKFFFEIIGQLLPGFLFLVGLYFVLPEPVTSFYSPSSEIGYWALIGAAYATGCALTSLGSYVFIPTFLAIVKSPFLSWALTDRMKRTLMNNREIDKDLVESESYKFIQCQFPARSSLRTLRNVAMSSIGTSDKETTIRFMFLSLLSQGIATSLMILAVIQMIIFAPGYGVSNGIGFALAVFIIVLIVTLPFVLREREFFDRARRLPLDSFLATLKSNSDPIPTRKVRKTVYLSGGHHSGWQNAIANRVEGFDFIDPSKNGLSDPKLYTAWDLDAIRKSDIIFAYFEDQNPSGYGLSLEIGYAAGLGKYIIFVDEKSSATPEVGRYLHLIRETSNVVFESLDGGLECLRSLS